MKKIVTIPIFCESHLVKYQIPNIIDTINPDIIKKVSAKKGFFKNPLRFFLSRIRQIENISVIKLTSSEHADRVEDFHGVEPGDLIRTWSGKHVLLVTEVNKQESQVK